LHPYQYYDLAKYYLQCFDLDKAQICVQKLRAMNTNKEAPVLAERLEKSLMPRDPVPEEAMKKFKAALELKEKPDVCKELTQRYPNFEWPYLILASLAAGYDESSYSTRSTYLKKILEINPHNVRALMSLSDIANMRNEKAEAYKYLQQAEKYYPEIVNNLDYQIVAPPATKSEAKQEKEIKRYNDRVRAGTVSRPTQFPTAEVVQVDYRFIDKTGKLVFRVGPNVQTSDTFSDGLLLVNGSENRGKFQSEDVQYWDKNGDLVFSTGYSDGASASEGYVGVQRDWGRDFSRGWGFCDKRGKPVIVPKQYIAETKSFHEQLAAVELSGFSKTRMHLFDFGARTWGFFDIHGSWHVEPIYSDLNSFREGRAAVCVNSKIGFIDSDGLLIIPPNFDLARSFSEGLANVVILNEQNRTWDDQYIDVNGKIAFHEITKIPGEEPLRKWADEGMLRAFQPRIMLSDELRAEETARKWDFHNGLVAVRVDTKYGYKNRDGKTVIQPQFDDVREFSDGLAMVKVAGKKGFIDTTGKIVVPAEYQEAKSFSEGLAAVSRDGKTWGYIDKQGKAVIEMKYLEAYPFAEGLAKVGTAK